ncbi:MAG: leucine-rich repeat domain-containing protein [Gammaproteobacteria bacterium]|nr:leucine-rich repeat domain-containing protein [Gammaproteobacteria bacterium]
MRHLLSLIISGSIGLLILSCSSEHDYVYDFTPDKNLATCIIDEMSKRGYTNPSQINTLVCQKGVIDLTGLDQLSELESLYIQDNQLTDLSTLGKMPSLKTISVAGSNTLSSLSGIGSAPNLEEVQANKTPKLTDISDLQYLNKLKIFAAMMANIDDIRALRNLEYLKEVVLNYNSITDLSPLERKPRLVHLQAYSNPINYLGALEDNFSLKLLGIDKDLVKLCNHVDAIRKALSKDAKIYGPENCR